MSYASWHNVGAVGIVTLDRPDRLNAIGTQWPADLHEALTRAQADPDTRAIVFTGPGRAFCAGDDLEALGAQVAERSAFATSRLKKVVTAQLDPAMAQALEAERQAAMDCFGQADTARRIEAFTKARL